MTIHGEIIVFKEENLVSYEAIRTRGLQVLLSGG